ncbi:hypothetical protein VV93_v1c06620 [Vibrio vulnificus]|uniref:hypothetical protein n=1 Tax=Vibrio vulnificus TaxID=672 RepID=UPI0004F8CA9D|nr:hypothetical protein [Vibrio vulnificus]AIL69758.1 hypothetical protein VV93_v1c06620 [Vibrio vulnificus]PWY31457.1 hypothetical protein VV97_06385 [Vibrio vulnificus]
MNTDLQINLNKLKTDIKDAVFNAQPKRYNGNADYFIGLIGAIIDMVDYNVGDSEHLKKNIAYRLKTSYDNQGKKLTNWGYKNVLVVVEQAFKYINK